MEKKKWKSKNVMAPAPILAEIAAARKAGKQAKEEEEEEEDIEKEEEEEELDPEVVRAYEKQKLKYYFAVATCDTKGTADAIYREVDGLEVRRGGREGRGGGREGEGGVFYYYYFSVDGFVMPSIYSFSFIFSFPLSLFPPKN